MEPPATAPTSIDAALPPLPAGTPPPARVAEVVRAAAVKVPSWFTAAAALQVARLKRAAHLVVLDRQQLVGSVETDQLAAAPAHEPVARWMNASRTTVGPDTPQSEARALMDRQGVACLPVVSGALLLGIVTRTDLC
jgi:acetoin utilization protein AcuB